MIITLCGSSRFEPWYHAWNEALSLTGHCVFGLASYPSQHDGKKDWYTVEQKAMLDEVHRYKIEASDAILVLNVFAYIGDSTMREIRHACYSKKDTYFLESWGEGFGIGSNHFKHIQEAARRLGVPEGYGSPINTVESKACPSPWRLLGDAGPYRSMIVSSLRRQIGRVVPGYE